MVLKKLGLMLAESAAGTEIYKEILKLKMATLIMLKENILRK